MDLSWGEIEADYIQWAFDGDGKVVAQISGNAWPRSAWVHPRWCGVENGVLLRDIYSWEEGRTAVERCIADYLAGVRDPPGRPSRRSDRR